MSSFQRQSMSSCAVIVRSIMTQVRTHREPSDAEECEDELVKKCQKLTPTQQHFHVCTLNAKHAHKPIPSSKTVSQPIIRIAVCQNNKHLVNTLLSPHLPQCWPEAPSRPCISVYSFTEIFTFLHSVHLRIFTSAYSVQHLQRRNCGHTPTNVTFNSHSPSRKHMRTYTLLHREPCCVLSGGTQMAATWCVLMGSCDGFGQDMDTHTDGDPLRVDGRWTC